MSLQNVLRLTPTEVAGACFPDTAHFTVTATSEPSVLARVLENFTLRNLVPEKLNAEIRGEQLVIEVQISGLSAREISHLELRMQNIFPVLSVKVRQCQSD